MQKKLIISLLVGSALSLLAMYLAFRNVPAADLIDYLKRINFWWLVPSFTLVAVTFVLRVYRWQIILKGTGDVGFQQAFHPLMIGFMMNCILPGRVGEIARPALLRKNRGIPMTAGLATVAAERVMDIIFLIILFLLTFSSILNRADFEFSVTVANINIDELMLRHAVRAMVRLSLFLLAAIVLMSFRKVQRWLKTIILAIAARLSARYPGKQDILNKMAHSGIRLVEHTAAGFALVRHPRHLMTCIGLTITIWGLTVFTYYVFSIGCPGVKLSLWQLTTYNVVICFFIALPTVPGFWGVWEAGGVFALSLFGIAADEAAGFTLVTHSLLILPVIIIGMISALVTSVNILKVSGTAWQPLAKGDML